VVSRSSRNQGDRPIPSRIRLRVQSTEVEYEGRIADLQAELPPLLDLVTQSHNGQVKAELLQQIESIQSDLDRMNESHINSVQLEGRLAEVADGLGQSVGNTVKLGGKAECQQLVEQLQEIQMRYSLQYIQLQSQMQDENRNYSAVSNIMKTKHDTVKNSISNIR